MTFEHGLLFVIVMWTVYFACKKPKLSLISMVLNPILVFLILNIYEGLRFTGAGGNSFYGFDILMTLLLTMPLTVLALVLALFLRHKNQ